MEPNAISDYWNDSGGGSDGELRYALESFCDVPPPEAGSGFKEVYDNCCDLVQIGSSKRVRGESYSGSRSKACREKMRRDRVNDMFLELSSVLNPCRPPKSDKANILCDATRLLAQLKAEAEQLKAANEKLQETVKELKAEKNELREEKVRLKLEKEKLEKLAGFMPQPIALHPATNPAAAVYAAHGKAHAKKAAPFSTFSGMAMWQWLPPAILDTTQDLKLWPPHA